MSLAVIIPSRNSTNLIACLDALRLHEPDIRVIVVDDGLDVQPTGCEYVMGAKPFVYARNVNFGIMTAFRDDVVMLNDDALLQSPHGLTQLRHQWREHPEYGLIGAAMDACGTPEQWRLTASDLRTVRTPPVIFACCFIPRSTIDKIGLLDTRFGANAGGAGARGYGCEDDDYCWRVREAGLLLGVYDGCFVNHTTLRSTFRMDKEHKSDVTIHERIFEQKWGRHPRRPPAWT